MSRRSRMAVRIALAVAALAAGARAGEPVQNTVQLQLQVSGLADRGCMLEIRPAHPGCRFEPVRRRIEGYAPGGHATLKPIAIAATSLGADRDCTFAITLQEPGQPPRTYRRGLRLVPAEPGRPAPVQTLRAFLSAPTLAARDEAGRVR